MLFGKNKKVILWPKSNSTVLYVDRETDNVSSFPVNLYKENPEIELLAINEFLKKEKPTQVVILLTDEVMSTKSFVSDANTTIDKNQVAKLAQDVVSFEINPENIEYVLVQNNGKTIIQADLFHKTKFPQLEANLLKLSQLPDKVEYLSQARAVSRVVNQFYKNEYFVLYSYEDDEASLTLSRGEEVFLTNKIKKNHPDIQKIINYSNLYFDKAVNRVFHAKNINIDYKSTSTVEKAEFEEPLLASQLKLPQNMPLPVLGSLLSSNIKTKPVVVKPVTEIPVIATAVTKPVVEEKKVEKVPEKIPVEIPVAKPPIVTTMPSLSSVTSQDKNLMSKKRLTWPLVVAFLVSLLGISATVWYFSTRGETDTTAQISPTPAPIVEPTSTPVPTLPPINPKLKFQVLNATEINGQAAKLKSDLQTLGFKDVTAGNAKEKTTTNKINTKKKYADLEAYFAQTMPAFEAEFTTTLPDSSTYDVVVTIGEEITGSVEAPKPTEKPSTKTPTPADEEEVVEEE